jgi:hypothetical protein
MEGEGHMDGYLERTLTGYRFIFSRIRESFIPEVLVLSLEIRGIGVAA